ncbi:Misacylated_tRNA(Ala) deacylase [Hexamita inflata]|uniref:Putative n=1 Tax=Hexamita inflata TaxID=28002 RepID=A0AA86UZM9_9EUKA|nr:Misacylated tRNA(Ala) deacylase [Hexamita inflata]
MHRYIQSPKVFEFETQITEVKQVGELFHVTLAESYYFPEAGGQPADRGTINGVKIVQVIDQHPIVHVLEQNPGQASAKCIIDKAYRLENSRQHTGQHILSAVALSMFGADSSSFKIAEPYSTVELNKKLVREQLDALQLRVNEIILENIPVTSTIINDLDNIPSTLRHSYNFVPLRLVQINNIDTCPCCGSHVQQTGELGQCSIFGVEPVKTGMKLYFSFGLSCLGVVRNKLQIVNKLCEQFTCGDDILVKNVENAVQNVKFLQKKFNDVFKKISPLWITQNTFKTQQYVGCFIDFTCESADANFVVSTLQKENAKVIVAFVDGNATNITICDKEGGAEAMQKKIEEKGFKMGKCGGNAQRRTIIVEKKLTKENITQIAE